MSAPDFTLSVEGASSLQRVGRRTGLEPSVARRESRGLVGVGGLRQRGSARFAPYYKAQWYDEKQLAWSDVQKQFATPDDARAAFKKGKWRVMEITMTGRHPL